MASINGRANKVKQPRGGYINPRMFHGVRMNEDFLITDNWNIHKSLVNNAVDGLTKVVLGTNPQIVFKEELSALKVAEDSKIVNNDDFSNICEITGINKVSIINACKLVAFGIWGKNAASTTIAPRVLIPSADTIMDISKMVKRNIKMFDKCKGVLANSFTFGDGYTKLVDNGYGGYITNGTIWDVKVSLNGITSKDTLKIVMQYIMGNHSSNSIFKNISRVGIFNSRLNVAYILKVSEIHPTIIREIESDVLGYPIKVNNSESTRSINIKDAAGIDVFQFLFQDNVAVNDTITKSNIYNKLKAASDTIIAQEVKDYKSDVSDIASKEVKEEIKQDSSNTTIKSNKVDNAISLTEVDDLIDLTKIGNSTIRSDFEEAALQGRLSRVISIYRSRDIDKEEFISAFEYATERRNLDIIDWMLNIKPNYKHDFLISGMVISAVLGYLEMTKYIIKLDKDMYVRKNGLSIALHLAIVNNNMEVVQYITRRNGSMCDVLRDDVIYLYKNGFTKEGKYVYNIYKKRNPKDKSLGDIIHGHEASIRMDRNIKRRSK